jgi:hypothetical protein
MVAARKVKRFRWSYKEDRRFIELAESKSFDEIAKLLGRKPGALTKAAVRLGISLKTQANGRAGRE